MTFKELQINRQFQLVSGSGDMVFRKVARHADECYALDESDGYLMTVSMFIEVIQMHNAHRRSDVLTDQEPPQMA